MITINGKVCSNWKEYFFVKFDDKSIFNIKQIESEYDNYEFYKVSSTDKRCNTEIIIKLYIDQKQDGFHFNEKYINLLDKKLKDSYLKQKDNISYNTELFDVYFINPDSPNLTASNESNVYGLDGFGTEFTRENVKEIDELLNIPIYHGWKERTTFYDNESVRIDYQWQQNGETHELELYDSDSNKYGCLFSFLLIFLENFLHKHKFLKKRTTKRIEEEVIEPMIKK